MLTGVYYIYNNISNRLYIGSSNDIERRFKQHIRKFQNKTHENKHMQAAWCKYGETAFSFGVLVETSEEDQYEMEQKCIDHYPWDSLYNMNPYASKPPSRRGKHHSEEARKKLSEAKKGDKHYLYGKHLSEEHRRKLSEANKGDKHYLYGKHLPEATRKKISEAKEKKPVMMVDKDTDEVIKEFKSMIDAARYLGKSSGSISSACTGRYKSAYGFKWKFKEK